MRVGEEEEQDIESIPMTTFRGEDEEHFLDVRPINVDDDRDSIEDPLLEDDHHSRIMYVFFGFSYFGVFLSSSMQSLGKIFNHPN